MIDDVTGTQQDLHPTINHHSGIYTPGERLTKREEGEDVLGNRSISECYSASKCGFREYVDEC